MRAVLTPERVEKPKISVKPSCAAVGELAQMVEPPGAERRVEVGEASGGRPERRAGHLERRREERGGARDVGWWRCA